MPLTLENIGARTIRLLTNNPEKIYALEDFGLKITEMVPLEIKPQKYDYKYLYTKKTKMGHLIRSL